MLAECLLGSPRIQHLGHGWVTPAIWVSTKPVHMGAWLPDFGACVRSGCCKPAGPGQ